MRSTRALLPLLLVVFAAACSGSETSPGSATGSGGASSGSTTGSGGASPGSATGSGGASSGSTTGSGGASPNSTTGSSGASPNSTTGSGQGASGGAGSAGGAGGAGGMVEGPGTDTTVTPFDETPFYFTSDDDRRVVDAPVSFPSTGTYERITLHLSLECPPGGCDPWARLASLGVVTAKDPAGDTVIELMRFFTRDPYGAGVRAVDGADRVSMILMSRGPVPPERTGSARSRRCVCGRPRDPWPAIRHHGRQLG
ncbi:hypothetical protein [Sorangium sp. So ce693]|uniref:hypothetical protein n=1 Tax=Sorangium sp. So ce693 TaxID=3133318 RepID=UPI003F6320EA